MRGVDHSTNSSCRATAALLFTILLAHAPCFDASRNLRRSQNASSQTTRRFHLVPVDVETHKEAFTSYAGPALAEDSLRERGPLADAAAGIEQWGSSASSGVALSPRTVCDPIANISRSDGIEEVCGPQVIIGGAMKCGTNSLAQLLTLHPRLWINRCPEGCTPSKCGACEQTHYQGDQATVWESHYFTHRTTYHNPSISFLDPVALQNLSDVIAHTDGTNSITLDKSPSYLDTHLFPSVAADVKRLLPHAKVIFSLCEPAGRLYAEYYHNLRYDQEAIFGYFTNAGEAPPSSFTAWAHALLDKKHKFCLDHPPYCARMREEFLGKGSYLRNLQPWNEAFGQHNLLVLTMTEPAEVKVRRMLAHLGLPEDEFPWDQVQTAGWVFKNADYGGRSEAWKESPREMKRLATYYKAGNAELAKALHADWPLAW